MAHVPCPNPGCTVGAESPRLIEQLHFAFALMDLLQSPDLSDSEGRQLAVARHVAAAPFAICAVFAPQPAPAEA
jgi:hypothetical protein